MGIFFIIPYICANFELINKMGLFDFLKRDANSQQPIKEKIEISDFFNIDINNIFQYNPEYIKSDISISGNEIKHYKLRLKELELGLFYEIEIILTSENKYNLIFKGRNNTITNELKKFVEFYTSKHGLDDFGNGNIENADYNNLARHIFSRMWGGNLWIDNMDLEERGINMTIFG